MIALILAAFLVAQTAQQVAPPAQTAQEPDRSAQAAVAVPETESSRHLVGQRPILRVSADQAKHTFFSSIQVRVTVDATGTVTAANALHEMDNQRHLPGGSFDEAESLVRALHYKPFERGGHAVPARFREYVFLLPPEILPSRHVPFPRVKNLKSVKITLQRTECFGSCPSYSVEVHGDGTVTYEGQSSVAFTGRHRGAVPRDDVLELLKLFKAADYFSLDDKYSMSVTDNPTYITSIEMDGRRKQVSDYVGYQIGMPLAVSHLESEIDRLSGSARWIEGNADTLSALQAEHWDFKSSEAAATLARVAERGNADAVRDLVNAGVPTVAKDGSESALVTAAHRGDLVMLSALLDAGAASHTASLDMSLHASAASGSVETFQLLLRHGAHIDSRDLAGHTILMSAAASGAPAMVKEVLKHQPDVNAAAHASQAMIEASGESDFPDGQTALMIAVSQNTYDVEPEGVDRAEVVRLLLGTGADPNARDKHSNTALILCAQRADIALLLIKAGADVNARNDKGTTALSNTDDDDVKRVLLEHGATDQDR